MSLKESKKFRCSALGRLMVGAVLPAASGLTEAQQRELDSLVSKGEGRTEKQKQRMFELLDKRQAAKTPSLSKGAMTFIEDEFMKDRFDYFQSFSNKYTEKGNHCEAESIRQVGKMLGYNFASKAKPEYLANEYICTSGYDWKVKDFVFDQKNVWEPKGLKLFDEGSELAIYEWQIRGYAMLLNELKGTEIKHGAVIRVLMNPPERILMKEAKRLWFEAGNSYDEPMTMEFYEEVEECFNFEGKFPDVRDRVRIHVVECTDEHFELIRQQCRLAQNYYSSLLTKIEDSNDEKIKFLAKK